MYSYKSWCHPVGMEVLQSIEKAMYSEKSGCHPVGMEVLQS